MRDSARLNAVHAGLGTLATWLILALGVGSWGFVLWITHLLGQFAHCRICPLG